MANIVGSGTLQDLSARAIGYTHPIYTTWAPTWIKLAHVREGAGGFMDGTYLIAHPREWQDYTATTPKKPTKKLKARRAMAAYENFAAGIIEAKKAALFREHPVRRIGSGEQTETTPLEQWWEDVDGLGTSIDEFMTFAWDTAATFGHTYIYFEQAADGTATTAADAKRPYLCIYTPLDVTDWIETTKGELTAVKMVEGVPRSDFTQLAFQPPLVRVVTDEMWSTYDSQRGGKPKDGAAHQLGRLPVVPLFAQRRPLLPQIGASVLQDPKLFIDLYNLLSELRELLRNQTFSILNVPLGTGADAMGVEEAKALIGTQSGTENVLFSATAASFIAADAANVIAYQEEIQRRLRMVYRLCALHWDSDRRGVEATGSVELKREDMNQRLAAYADELEQTEYQIVDLWYRATYGAEAGPKKMEQDGITIHYPDTFEVTPFDVVIQQAQAAASLGMPTEFLKELRKDLAPKFLPSATPDTLATINDAIDAAAPDLTPDQRLQARVTAMTASNGKTPPPKKAGGPPDPNAGA